MLKVNELDMKGLKKLSLFDQDMLYMYVEGADIQHVLISSAKGYIHLPETSSLRLALIHPATLAFLRDIPVFMNEMFDLTSLRTSIFLLKTMPTKHAF